MNDIEIEGNSLAKYEQRSELKDSGYGSFYSGSTDENPTAENNDTKELDLPLENLTITEESSSSLSSSERKEKDNKQIANYLISAFTPDNDNDTYLTILIAKNELPQAAQLIQICPQPEYLDMQNNLGQAGIHVAAYLNVAGIVHMLILNGARIDLVDVCGKNVFHICAENGHFETLNAVIDAAIKTNQINLMRIIANERDFSGYTPFYLAVNKKKQKICDILTQLKVDVDMPDSKSGNSPLHEAVVARNADASFVEFLIRKCEMNVNYQNYDSVTPLHIAASTNNISVVRALLNSGANPNLEDATGRKPCDYNEHINQYLQS